MAFSISLKGAICKKSFGNPDLDIYTNIVALQEVYLGKNRLSMNYDIPLQTRKYYYMKPANTIFKKV